MVDYLWKIIDIAKTTNESHKNNLAGNISQSLLLDDLDNFFYKSVCVPLIKFYRDNNSEGDPVSHNTLLGPKTKLLLNQIIFNLNHLKNLEKKDGMIFVKNLVMHGCGTLTTASFQSLFGIILKT